jgi:transposase-like protein
VHTNQDVLQSGRSRRRRHSAEFKAKMVAACKQPGISIASVALPHGLNANLLRRWIVEHDRPSAEQPQVPELMDTSQHERRSDFVPVTVAPGAGREETDNAYIESFNGRFREECLNANWFLSLDDARRKIEAWRADYNEARPHSAERRPLRRHRDKR